MLLSFTAENFRAFRDPVELSLRRIDAETTETAGSSWDPQISTLAAVYGANASGKSTLVEAIRFFAHAVRDSFASWPVKGGTPVLPFLLDAAWMREASRFEAQIRASDGLDYQYWFEIDDQRVIREELYVFRTTSRRTKLFARKGSELAFGDSFTGTRAAVQEALTTRSNALALSVIAQFGNRALEPVFEAITDIRTYDACAFSEGEDLVVKTIEDDPELLAEVAGMLSQADLGISDITLGRPTPELVSQLEEVFREQDDQTPPEVVSKRAAEAVDRLTRRPVLHHRGRDGQTFPLPAAFESQGTMAALSFAPVMLLALREGSTIVVDEIDSSLHPAMVHELVSLFANPETNPRQAQLVFTTHDTTLLSRRDPRLLARDQVWIAEKNPDDGSADLIPVSEYSPRKDESLERGYLSGRYGGVPVLQIRDFVASAVGSR